MKRPERKKNEKERVECKKCRKKLINREKGNEERRKKRELGKKAKTT